MSRPPSTRSREWQHLILKLERDLARFQRIPARRRKAECADEGEATCRQLLQELGVQSTLPAPMRDSSSVAMARSEVLDELKHA